MRYPAPISGEQIIECAVQADELRHQQPQLAGQIGGLDIVGRQIFVYPGPDLIHVFVEKLENPAMTGGAARGIDLCAFNLL
ncbi:hypothetical protein [Mycobacteroides abscessus]|uniref:hypothetical protein n=1 Tax=Mycobacteroides abscessus TaxID=36809 RepID=UPI0002E6025E|nr:hypothetical protein [Mycobacteroides abscessus]